MPAFYLFAQNSFEMPFTDIVLPLAASVLLGAAALLFFRLLTKDWPLAGLLSTVCMGLFLNFNFIILLVDAFGWPLRYLVYYGTALGAFLLLAALILLVHRLGGSAVAVRLLLIVFAVVFAINVMTAAPGAVQRLTATSYTAGSGKSNPDADLPNFYYLVADEYASFQELETYYGYDNGAFHDFLTDRGFCVSDESYNPHANTMYCMADNVNLDHVTGGSMDMAKLQALVNNGVLYGALEGLGYDLCQLGELFPLPALQKRNVFSLAGAATMNGESATELLMGNSMLKPLEKSRYWRIAAAEQNMARFDYLDDPAFYHNVRNRALFFYVLAPHPPFFYDANGDIVPDRPNWTNWTDKRYYLDQLIYTTKRLETSIDTILENDPTAIILLQSDHGLRYHDDSDMPHDFQIDWDDQRRILNALYFGGRYVDIRGLSGYNTLRAVLNELGLDYPILPEN